MAIRAPVTKIPEVRCSECRVSFPPEVKRCIHCGGRTHAPGVEPATLLFRDLSATGSEGAMTPVPIDGAPPMEVEEESDLERPTRGPLRMISALVWILLALAGALYRACGGGA